LFFFSGVLSLVAMLGHSTFICPCFPQPKHTNLVELESDLFLPLLPCWFFNLFFIFMNFWNFFVNRLRFSDSLQSSELSSVDSWTTVLVLSSRLLVFFSTVSISFNLIISSSCSLNLPNSAAVVSVVKSLVSEIVVTLGYQLLSKHFRILILNSSLSNCLPSPIRWLTMCVNLFWISTMVSPCYILNSSYS